MTPKSKAVGIPGVPGKATFTLRPPKAAPESKGAITHASLPPRREPLRKPER